jgi:hypothetical protein
LITDLKSEFDDYALVKGDTTEVVKADDRVVSSDIDLHKLRLVLKAEKGIAMDADASRSGLNGTGGDDTKSSGGFAPLVFDNGPVPAPSFGQSGDRNPNALKMMRFHDSSVAPTFKNREEMLLHINHASFAVFFSEVFLLSEIAASALSMEMGSFFHSMDFLRSLQKFLMEANNEDIAQWAGSAVAELEERLTRARSRLVDLKDAQTEIEESVKFISSVGRLAVTA